MRTQQAVAAGILVATVLAGCMTPSPAPETKPLQLAHVLIDQGMDAGPLPGVYAGTLHYPACILNPNAFPVLAAAGAEVYQVQPDPQGGLKLVERQGGGKAELEPGTGWDAAFSAHHVLINETAEGGTDYAIHLWYEIYDPEPIHRVDRWWNVTFVPYAKQTFFEEGTRC